MRAAKPLPLDRDFSRQMHQHGARARDEGLKPHIVNEQAMIMLNTGSDIGRNGFWIELPSFVFTTQATYQITSRSVAVVR